MPEEWICIGKRRSTGGGLALFFQTPNGDELGYAFKGSNPMKHARPGNVFRVEISDNGKLLSNSGRFLRTTSGDQVTEWIAESEATEAAFEAERRAKNAAQTQTIAAVVAPIRELYRRTVTPAQRRAILMSVMEAITR